MTNSTDVQRASRARAFTQRALMIIDIALGVVSVAAGLVAFVAPPNSIIHAVQWPVLIWVWGLLLVLGGGCLAAGRIMDRWLFQTSGIVAMMFGAGIYFVVLITATTFDLGVGVAAGMVFLATLLLFRRYLELQAFTATPSSGAGLHGGARFRHILSLGMDSR